MRYLARSAHVPISVRRIFMSQLQSSNVPINVSRNDIVCITYVFFNSPMKIISHIIRRTEQLGINHLTSTIDFVLSRIFSQLRHFLLFTIEYMADMPTSFNRKKCNAKFKVG